MYNHVLMGRPYNHKALPVALYDRLLAEFTYKLMNIHASEDVAAELFPHASKFHEASKTFCRQANGVYPDEEGRRKITSKWLDVVLTGKSIEQVPIAHPSNTSPWHPYTPPTRSESRDNVEDEVSFVYGVEMKAGSLATLPILVDSTHAFDNQMQNVKLLARYLLGLKVCSLILLVCKKKTQGYKSFHRIRGCLISLISRP